VTELNSIFREKISKGNKLFLPYLTFAYPNMDIFYDILSLIEDSGADAIEIGIPFSDPVADGPTIQRSSAAALKRGASLKGAFSELVNIKNKIGIPMLFMSYYNPILALGKDRFLKLSKNKLDGLVIPDLPLEEANEFIEEANSIGLALASFISPTTSKSRAKKIDQSCNGFIYYISSAAVTGVKDTFSKDTIDMIREFKKSTTNPFCVGFGISKEKQVLELKKVADGIIIGSAIIKIIDKNLKDRKKMIKELSRFFKNIRRALDE
jgi:tryptophan synthase alpha chain